MRTTRAPPKLPRDIGEFANMHGPWRLAGSQSAGTLAGMALGGVTDMPGC